MGPGGFRRLQNDCDLTTSGRVGSIPSRSRHAAALAQAHFALGISIAIGAVGLGLLAAMPLEAQARADTTRRSAATDSLAVPGRLSALSPQSSDSIKPPISPGRAFLYSFALPGLGQARLERHLAGAIYVTVEAVAIGMAIKASTDLDIASEHQGDVIVNRYQTDPATGAPIVDQNGNFLPADTVHNRYVEERVKSRRTHVEDWIAVLLFNHLFAGADAFVAAHLWDLPARVGFRPTRRGGELAISFRW